MLLWVTILLIAVERAPRHPPRIFLEPPPTLSLGDLVKKSKIRYCARLRHVQREFMIIAGLAMTMVFTLLATPALAQPPPGGEANCPPPPPGANQDRVCITSPKTVEQAPSRVRTVAVVQQQPGGGASPPSFCPANQPLTQRTRGSACKHFTADYIIMNLRGEIKGSAKIEMHTWEVLPGDSVSWSVHMQATFKNLTMAAGAPGSVVSFGLVCPGECSVNDPSSTPWLQLAEGQSHTAEFKVSANTSQSSILSHAVAITGKSATSSPTGGTGLTESFDTVRCDAGDQNQTPDEEDAPPLPPQPGCVYPAVNPEVIIDAKWMPYIAKNIVLAQQAGKDELLTRGPNAAARITNRTAACSGFVAQHGGQCDEYPFASSAQGGAGARTEEVHPRENACQAQAILKAQRTQHIARGESYYVRVRNPEFRAGDQVLYTGKDDAIEKLSASECYQRS